jgi:hypothetical protein
MHSRRILTNAFWMTNWIDYRTRSLPCAGRLNWSLLTPRSPKIRGTRLSDRHWMQPGYLVVELNHADNFPRFSMSRENIGHPNSTYGAIGMHVQIDVDDFAKSVLKDERLRRVLRHPESESW